MEFTIDRKIWRCGGDSPNPKNKNGIGETQLLNTEGFMCCLGQISEQAGVDKVCLEYCSRPHDIAPIYTKKVRNFLVDENCYNTPLSGDAMSINDDFSTSVQEKEKLLTKLFAEHGYELKFVGEYFE